LDQAIGSNPMFLAAPAPARTIDSTRAICQLSLVGSFIPRSGRDKRRARIGD
jgi:hypothetical protein